MLQLGRLNQLDLETASFQDLENGNPVHTRRFHGHGRDAALLEPVGQSIIVRRSRTNTFRQPRSGSTNRI
jgi:hypothetical protein